MYGHSRCDRWERVNAEGGPSVSTAVVITGTSYDSTTKNDVLTLEYKFTSGVLTPLSPVLRFSEALNSAKTQAPTSLAITGAPGSDRPAIFICGRSNGTLNGYYDYLVLGYPRDGNTDWVAYLDGEGHADDFATKIVLGQDQANQHSNVYVTGTSWSGTYNYDVVTRAYSKSGGIRWTNRTNYGYEDRAMDMVTNDEGHVYVTGKAFSTSGTDFDYRTIKIDSNTGLNMWTTSGPAVYNSGGTDAAAAVRILDDGLDHTIPDVFVTGRSLAPTDQTQKYATIRYTQD